MPHFLSRKHKKLSINFSEIDDGTISETPFWEVQRSEALEIITTFFTSWQSLWQSTKLSLGNLNLSEESNRRLIYYENEQKRTVVHLLAEILVAWEKDDGTNFSNAVVNLAKELRPSVTHFETDSNENFVLTPAALQILKIYTTREALTLKNAIEKLQQLSWHKFEFGDKVLTISTAEALIEEQLHLTYFDFLDFNTDPEFASGFLPELLQDSADFGL